MFIAGNWKMNTNLPAARALAEDVAEAVEQAGAVRVAVCPPFVSLKVVAETLEETPVQIGAQNMHFEDEGAFTGEVSAAMLESVGCSQVILGHSERRQYFNEEDALINKKAKQARRYELAPIVCVGETQEERQDNRAQEVVTAQVEAALDGVEVDAADQIAVAYEPIWAIGTGDTATPEQAQEMHAVIRELLQERFGEETGSEVAILYGGSMKPHNAEELLAQPDVDGGLLGGASLKGEDFAAIVRTARDLV